MYNGVSLNPCLARSGRNLNIATIYKFHPDFKERAASKVWQMSDMIMAS
jgi:hypothetical protein